MGGVDFSDKYRLSCSIELTSSFHKWTHPFWFGAMSTAMVNAFLLMKLSSPNELKSYSYHEFCADLQESMLKAAGRGSLGMKRSPRKKRRVSNQYCPPPTLKKEKTRLNRNKLN